jgi:pimeloyl-ACP methyl ester carboxylesterase
LNIKLANLALLLALGLAGCSHPIGANRVSGRVSYEQLNRSALNSDHCSDASEVVLHRFDLEEPFKKSPADALLFLHEKALTDDRRDLLFALAELNFLHAERLRHSVKPGVPRHAPDCYLSSAIYAYLFLLGEGREAAPGPFDRRFRLACDLYNRAVAQGFATGGPSNRVVSLEGGLRRLLPGPVQVTINHEEFKWSLDQIESFLPADEFVLRGLAVRDRQAGLGAPLIVVGKTLDEKKLARRFPATLFLRVPGDLKAWSEGRLAVSLELLSTYDQHSIQAAGRELPVESDTTAPLAYSLNEDWIWKLGTGQFFSFKERIHSKIYFTQPYQTNRIPVLFVHGTASSPIWWADMWNTLRTDPQLRERCQFWFFIYSTGNTVGSSAARLREEINRKVQQLDPDGKDPALRNMVVVGHSQGGLLTKLAVTDTGDKLWRAISETDFEQLKVPPEQLKRLRAENFFTPQPCVKRVVFISTPHHGSYLATSFVRSLVFRFMNIPDSMAQSASELFSLQNPLKLKPGYERRVPTSIDSMSPNNPWLLALADLPVASSTKAHSIIAIKGDDQPPEGGDGVVKYKSAHVGYVESEFIVRSSHSCQDKPATIEELRRILLEHLADSQATTASHQRDNSASPATLR